MITNRRAHFRHGLSQLYIPYYDSLCGILDPRWQPVQGFRTAKEQHSLYLIGRTGNFSHIKKKRTVTNADSGQSPHEYGCASDWTLFDQDGLPTWPKADDPVWDEYILAVEKVGLKPGAEFGDIPHNELRIKASWRHDVYPYFKEHGVLLTESFIQSVMA